MNAPGLGNGDEACFVDAELEDAIDAREVRDAGTVFAAVSVTPLHDPEPTLAVPAPANFAILPPVLLVLAAMRRRRRAS